MKNQNYYIDHYKDISPDYTVQKIQKIIHGLGIETTEIWQNESSVNTEAMRLTLGHTNYGTNGKGVSKIYAKASAYAEFLERLQNNLLSLDVIDGKKHGFKFHFSIDEIMRKPKEILEDSNSFIEFYLERMNLKAMDIEDQAQSMLNIHKLDLFNYNETSEFVTVPFSSTKENRTVYLPLAVYRRIYGSNGMCAGNTKYEALTQGLSEIFERIAQKRIMLEKPCLPDIPFSIIKKYPEIYNRIKPVVDNHNYFVQFKDCSFGGKYPVVALLIIEKNTGKYGIKLGCHPDFRIALERTITEITQGQDIYEYVNRSHLDFANVYVDKAFNVANSYRVGYGQYPYEIFGSTPSWTFVAQPQNDNISNEEMFTSWIRQLHDDGYDVLIRDVSFLGFPSYHIIIPGLSEMHEMTPQKFRAFNTREYVKNILRGSKTINDKDVQYLSSVINYYKNDITQNTLSSYIPEIDLRQWTAEDIGEGCCFINALCLYVKKEYAEAGVEFLKLWKKSTDLQIKHTDFLVAYYICQAKQILDNKSTIYEYLRKFFIIEDYEEICRLLLESENALKIFLSNPKLYLPNSDYHEFLVCVLSVYRRESEYEENKLRNI